MEFVFSYKSMFWYLYFSREIKGGNQTLHINRGCNEDSVYVMYFVEGRNGMRLLGNYMDSKILDTLETVIGLQ